MNKKGGFVTKLLLAIVVSAQENYNFLKKLQV